ncbi:hypothetical protein D3C73_518820 [compost metagenome]
MLRLLFDEPRGTASGKQLQAINAIRDYIETLETNPRSVRDTATASQLQTKVRRLALWSKGFIDALNELEQSKYCCQRYSEEIHQAYIEDMELAELDHYHRFVYFYKNAFIRIFSVLDKLGYFMNDLYDLKTEKLKSKFSYFTVLRRMHEMHIHDGLEQQLYDLKNEYKGPMSRLRNHRNMEIHFINVEMLDDLSETQPMPGVRIHVENVIGHVKDLQAGFDMVCSTLTVAFTYITKNVKKG